MRTAHENRLSRNAGHPLNPQNLPRALVFHGPAARHFDDLHTPQHTIPGTPANTFHQILWS